MILLEAVVCDVVVLECIMFKGVSNICLTPLVRILETSQGKAEAFPF